MVTELAESLFDFDNMAQISAGEIEKCAGALGGLDPFTLDQIPEKSVFDALDTIKNNSNLSPRQVCCCCLMKCLKCC